MPEQGRSRRPQGKGPRKYAQVHACGKNHAEKNSEKDQRCAEIRLLQDKQERQGNIARNGQEILQRIELPDPILKERGQGDDHDDLREFRRLQRNGPELYPTLRAESRLPDDHDEDEHDNIEDVQILAVSLQRLVIKIHKKNGDEHIQDDEHTLFLNEPIAFLTRRIDMGRTADDDEAHDDDSSSRCNQRQIRAAQEALREYHRLRLDMSLPPC